MKSLALLPSLERVPSLPSGRAKFADAADVIRRLGELDKAAFSIELAAGLEVALLGLFAWRNVPDDLEHAYGLAFSRQNDSLAEHFDSVVDHGEAATMGFISNLKGKLAEVRLKPHLEDQFPGYDFNIAADPTQPIWDIRGVSDAGSDIFVQVKMGGTGYASDVVERMQDAPDVYFAVSDEIYTRIAENHPELVSRLIDAGESAFSFTDEINENLALLSGNLGLDLPDALGDILPYVAEVVLGIKLIAKIIETEKELGSFDLDARSRVHGIKSIMLFSRFGVTTVCTAAGGFAGSVFPGFGTLVGGIAGAYAASKLNKKIQPRMLPLALKLCSMTSDHLYFFQNIAAFRTLAWSFRNTTA